MISQDGASARPEKRVINQQGTKQLEAPLNNFREPSSLFMRASDLGRRFLAYFFFAVEKEVRRQQAKLEN